MSYFLSLLCLLFLLRIFGQDMNQTMYMKKMLWNKTFSNVSQRHVLTEDLQHITSRTTSHEEMVPFRTTLVHTFGALCIWFRLRAADPKYSSYPKTAL